MLARLARNIALSLVAAHLWAAPCLGDPHGAVRYSIERSGLPGHTVRVEAVFPPESFPGPERTLALPVWTPGSYKIRDYSKSITDVRLLDAGPARLEKTAKNRWSLVGKVPLDRPLKVSYLVYGHELSVRTNYFTPDLSLMVGAATFLAPAPLRSEMLEDETFEVAFPGLAPERVSTPLRRVEGVTGPTFQAAGYDELVDSPIVFGDLEELSFQEGGKPHILVQAGDRRYWNTAESLRDAASVVSEVHEFWGTVPYDRYHFFNLIVESRGGLEHLDSSVLMTTRFASDEREKYVEWLALVCHEIFHAWNVKRLRPAALGPFDYETEVYTPSLWVAEGITSYYDDLLVRRAGLSTRAEYLKALSGQLTTLAATPGRQRLPLTEASLDAWIRLYQPTDNSLNDNVSYYNKGAVVAWLLDTEIRRRTRGRKSLDTVMRDAYRAFSESGFEEGQFRRLVESSSGLELDDFFTLALDGTQELPLEPALEYWGLEWKAEDEKVASEPFLGVNMVSADARTVESVANGSPAAVAGIAPGDELIAIDRTRVPSAGPSGLLKYLKVGGSYPVLLSRQGQLLETTVKLIPQPAPKRVLKMKDGKGAQHERLESWLGPESSPPKSPAAQEKAP